MDIGVEGLAHFPGNVEAVVLERVEEQLPGHDHAGEQAFYRFRRCRRIEWRDQGCPARAGGSLSTGSLA